MPWFGKKEKKEEQPQKTVSYFVENIGAGTSCEYHIKRKELMDAPLKDREGKATNMTSSEACGQVLKEFGLPNGISYFAQTRKLIISEEARNKIEKDSELEKKFRKALGIVEGQEIPYKECS